MNGMTKMIEKENGKDGQIVVVSILDRGPQLYFLIAQDMEAWMPTQAGIQFPGSLSRKFLSHRDCDNLRA